MHQYFYLSLTALISLFWVDRSYFLVLLVEQIAFQQYLQYHLQCLVMQRVKSYDILDWYFQSRKLLHQ